VSVVIKLFDLNERLSFPQKKKKKKITKTKTIDFRSLPKISPNYIGIFLRRLQALKQGWPRETKSLRENFFYFLCSLQARTEKEKVRELAPYFFV
jgi:hypothetical protein